MIIKVVHINSAYFCYDTRIFIKECCSLSHFYDISLTVANALGDEFKFNARIIDVSVFKGRIKRMFNVLKLFLKEVLQLGADIFYLYDPELIPIRLKIKKWVRN